MLTLLAVALLVFPFAFADQPINFNYDSHGADWSCPKNGTKQSPILLSTSEGIQKSKESHLFGDFINTTGMAYYLNTTIYINTTDNFGSIYTRLIDGNSVPFKANQIRVRMHSQHKTEQGYYDLQIQIFHVELYTTTRNYRLAVGLLFNVSSTPDPFVQSIIDGYAQNKTSASIQIDLSKLLPKNVVDDYWFYLGSSTIPPCSQGRYHWVVSRRTHSITAEQKDSLEKILSQGYTKWPGNWRNIQAQNQNIVGFRHLTEVEYI